MSTTVLITHLMLCLMKITAASNQDCRLVESVSDYALFEHTFMSISGTRFESCAAACDADPVCYSFNYFIPYMTCELNNSSRRADSSFFLHRSRAVYLDKLREPVDYCQTYPCWNNGTCKIVRRHPGFECSCHEGFSGEKCEICSSSPFGLSNHKLPDQNFNASSSSSPFRPSDARLNANTSWVNEGTFNQFLQISFQPHSKRITGVATQGNPHNDWWVTRYNLQYSSDGVTWSYYEFFRAPGSRKEFAANQDRNTVITNQLQPPITAMYLRIAPTAWVGKIALRVEIYGCTDYN
ncbi:hypothetical protein ACROYT_G027040 [Oculina patagonica]